MSVGRFVSDRRLAAELTPLRLGNTAGQHLAPSPPEPSYGLSAL